MLKIKLSPRHAMFITKPLRCSYEILRDEARFNFPKCGFLPYKKVFARITLVGNTVPVRIMLIGCVLTVRITLLGSMVTVRINLVGSMMI